MYTETSGAIGGSRGMRPSSLAPCLMPRRPLPRSCKCQCFVILTNSFLPGIFQMTRPIVC